MYDTINMRLYADECKGVNFIEDLPQRLTGVQVMANTYTGELWLDGRLDNMRVTATPDVVQVKDGSLCKWYLGDNFKTLGKEETRLAIEKLGDTLHLPVEFASVTRLDVAANMIMQKPPEVYLSHLGALRYMIRLVEPNGIYYTLKSKAYRLAFYNKVIESKSKGDSVPELYFNRNVLRYEQRYTTRIAQRLKLSNLRMADLCKDDLCSMLIRRWQEAYTQIQKINKSTINFSMIKTKRDFYKLGILALIERAGDANEILSQITLARKAGQLSSKQALDLRAAVKNACQMDGKIVRESEAVQELDKKVAEAAMIYL